MSLALHVPESWAITDAGMSCDGLHAIDRIWVGRDTATPNDVVVYGEHPMSGETFELRKTITANGRKPVDLNALLLEIRNLRLGLDDFSMRPLFDLVMDACAEATPFSVSLAELTAEWDGPDVDVGAAPAVGADPAGADPFKRLSIVDLGDVMRNGVHAPAMLVPDLVVKGEPHLWFGPKQTGKTWFILYATKWLIGRGETVVYVDKEMGATNVAERLVALGADPDLVTKRVVYMDRPSLTEEREPREQWCRMLLDRRPALVVVDAFQEVLGNADLNENMSGDVLKWCAWYLEPALRLGCATVMLDHTGHSEEKRSRGTSAKGQTVRFEFEFQMTSPIGRDRVGVVEVRTRKNALAAYLPEVQLWRVGVSDDEFVMSPDAMPSVPDGADPNATDERVVKAVENLLRSRPGERLSKNQVRGIVTGRGVDIDRALVTLADSDASPVCAEPDGRGVRYWYPLDGSLVSSTSSGLENHTPDNVGRSNDLVPDDVGRSGTK